MELNVKCLIMGYIYSSDNHPPFAYYITKHNTTPILYKQDFRFDLSFLYQQNHVARRV